MRTIDPRNLPTAFTITEARTADLGEHPRLLDGFLYIGLTVLFSEPGLGKSMLAAAVEEHLAFGRPFGPWAPEHPCRCLVVDLEGDMRLASERSLANTPWGLLPSDHGRPMPTDIEYETEWPGAQFVEKYERLRERLETAVQTGAPYRYVRIDTLRLFLGGKPHGANAYEWDAFCLGKLNRLALFYDLALVVVHHTNKAGEVSGSTGVSGSAVVVAQLKRNPDNDDECLIMSHKVRVDAPFRWPVMMDERGRWTFTEDLTPTQVQLSGTKRRIVDILTGQGQQEMKALREAMVDVSPNTIKAALRRLSGDGIVRYTRGHWTLSQTALAELPKCSVCGLAMEAYSPGVTYHPTCTPDPDVETSVRTWLGVPTPPIQVPAPRATQAPAIEDDPMEEPEDLEADHPEVHKWPAFAEMRKAIDGSRMKPLPNVLKVERDHKPWSLVVEKMDGQHRVRDWSGQLPEGTERVVVLDRNGSYPSAMSSVPVAPNKLLHSGALGADPLARQNLAGLFEIECPGWTAETLKPGYAHFADKIPHPLGRLAVSPGELVTITGSHMELLDRLARDGVLPVVNVVDSWTGRRNTSLFEGFYKWAKTVREETAGADEETKTAAKRAISTAIRSLHPKQARSPFWRPDWHKSVVAQASVRHWIKAWVAVQAGDALLSIGAVDEVAFAVPADAPAKNLWLPTGYKIGYGFGEVKHKEIKVGDDTHVSPVTVEQWKARGSRGNR
ncbi:AAA family ATPase [Streptomyces sp. NPDC001251]